MIRKLLGAIEILSFVVTIIMLASPSMDRINRVIGFLFVGILAIVIVAGGCLLVLIVRSQLEPPYGG